MHDMIRETPIYQEILREGIEKGREQGLVQVIIEIVQARFPSLLALARQRVVGGNNPAERLSQALVQLSLVQDEQAAEQVLLDLPTQSH